MNLPESDARSPVCAVADDILGALEASRTNHFSIYIVFKVISSIAIFNLKKNNHSGKYGSEKTIQAFVPHRTQERNGSLC